MTTPGHRRCACGHGAHLHWTDDVAMTRGGACLVTLPPFEEEELPAWACPCTRYAEPTHGPWRWHTGTSSWQAAAS